MEPITIDTEGDGWLTDLINPLDQGISAFKVIGDVENFLAMVPQSALARITVLDFSDNGMGPEGAQALAAVTHLANLTTLNLEFNRIGDDGAQALAAAKHLASLTSLNLGKNDIGPEGAQALAAATHLANLTALNLRGNAIGSEGTQALAAATNLASLTTLTLWNNKIGDDGAQAVAAAKHLVNLTSLDLKGNDLWSGGAQALAAATHLASLTTLDLSINRIGPEGAQALAAATHLANLTVLDLSSSGIGTWGTQALAAAKHLANLTALNLSSNQIGPKGAQALATATHLASLTTLNLEFNRIGDDGAQALAAAKHLASLTSLNLGKNDIGPEGAQALAAAKHLVSLTSLNLNNNDIGPEGAQALAAATHLVGLTTLDLEKNEIEDRGAQALAAATHLASLAKLGLNANKIGPKGAHALAAATHLASLTTLRLGFNAIGPLGAQALAAATHLASLTALDLERNEIGDDGARSLGVATHLAGLIQLSLGGNAIGDVGAHALAAAKHLAGLITLDLQFNAIGDAGAVAILFSEHLLRLRACNLRYSELSAPQDIQNILKPLRHHYRLARAVRRVPNRQVRALLIGAPAAGKTRFARLLAGAPETAPTRTLGIDRYSCDYPSIACRVNGEDQLNDVRLELWDMGGQTLQQMMHGLFLRDSQINLLVMRDPREVEAARRWLEQLVQQQTDRIGGSQPPLVLPTANHHPDQPPEAKRQLAEALTAVTAGFSDRLRIGKPCSIATITLNNAPMQRTRLYDAVRGVLSEIELPSYLEPVARLRPLIESGLAEPCYDMRDLRRLLREDVSFQQEHGLLTEALLATEGANAEPISAEQFAGMLISYLEQAGVLAVFRRDGDGIYDGLVVRDAAWIQKGLYSLLPPMALEDDVASCERDTFAAKLRSTSGQERLPGVFTEKDIRPLWRALGIAEADLGLLLKILTRPELGQVILLDEAVHHDQRRLFVPAYLEEIGEESEEQTLDRLAEGLIQSSFASCWSLPSGVHWPVYFVYRLMVIIHGTGVETLNREWGRRDEPTRGAFVLSDYGQRRCTIRHDQLLPGVALQLLFANDKIWCLAIPDRTSAERRDTEPLFEALETLIRIALGNILRSDPGVIRSLACPRCINDLGLELDKALRRRRLRALGSFEFKLVTHRDAGPTLTCARSHKLRPADILEPNHSVVEPVSNHIDYAVVRRAACQIAIFLYLGGMAKFSATSASAAVGGSQFYLTAKDLDDAHGPAAEGIIRTGNFTRDWIPTRDTVYGDSHRTIIGWCRYLARSSLMVRQICRITDPEALSEIDLCRAFMEGSGRVYTDPDQFIGSWPTLMGHGKPPKPIHPTKSFLEKLQAQQEGHYDPILEHFGLGADGARPKRTTNHRVDSKPRTAGKKKEQDDVP